MTPLVVEFVGLPGAGKTTVANKVVDFLKQQGFLIVGRSEIRRWIAQQQRIDKFLMLLKSYRVLLGRMATILRLYSTAQPAAIKTMHQFSGLLLMEVYLRQFLRTIKCTDIVLLDEWLVHSSWIRTQFLASFSHELLASLLESLVLESPRAFVWIDVELHSSVERIKSRWDEGNMTFRRHSPQNLAPHISRTLSWHRRSIDVVGNVGAPCLRLDGGAPIGDKVFAVVEWIKSIQGSPR